MNFGGMEQQPIMGGGGNNGNVDLMSWYVYW
jgi:hypothetical protein